MAHAQKPEFVFPRNGRVHLNRWGRQFSRLLAAEVYASALVMMDIPHSEVAWEYWLQFPLHFPSRASPCATRFRKSSTALFCHYFWSLNKKIITGRHVENTVMSCSTRNLKLVPTASISIGHYMIIINQPRKQVIITIYDRCHAATDPNFSGRKRTSSAPSTPTLYTIKLLIT